MRIVHVANTLEPSYGGPPRVCTRLAAGQAGLGHDVTIATYAFRGPLDDYHDLTRRMPGYDRVHVVQLDEDGVSEKVFGRRSRPTLRELARQADVVHLHNMWESILRVAALEAHAAGKPYVLQPNDMLNPWSLSQSRLKKRAALALGYRRMIEGSGAVLFGHEEEKRLAMQSGFHIKPVVLSLGGVFAAEVDPLPGPGGFYARVPALAGRPFVVFLSRLHYKKGLDYLAEGFAVAARKAPEAHLVVIGHDEGAQADFEQRIARHNLQSRVHLVGPQHGEAKWQAYRDAACFILPSRDEAFTVAITEALASGLPVVVSESCHYDDVAEYGAGTIVKLDAQSIGEALASILTDPQQQARMREAARRLFNDRLSFEQVASESIALYQRLQDGASRRA